MTVILGKYTPSSANPTTSPANPIGAYLYSMDCTLTFGHRFHTLSLGGKVVEIVKKIIRVVTTTFLFIVRFPFSRFRFVFRRFEKSAEMMVAVAAFPDDDHYEVRIEFLLRLSEDTDLFEKLDLGVYLPSITVIILFHI